MVAARVMTEPFDVEYIFINDSAIIRCYTTSDDNSTKEYVKNSVWFQSFPNQTPHQFDDSTSERIRVFMHTLIFSLVLSGDEGEYYCCTSVEGPCSEHLNIKIFGKQALHFHCNNTRCILYVSNKIFALYIASTVRCAHTYIFVCTKLMYFVTFVAN